MLDSCRNGDLRSAAAVLKMGLKPNRPLNVRPQAPATRCTHFATLHRACAALHGCALRSLQTSVRGLGGTPRRVCSPRAAAQNAGDTPLVLAVRFGKLELALLLLQHGAKASKGNKARALAMSLHALRRPLGRPRPRIERPAAQMTPSAPATTLLTLQYAFLAGFQEGVTALHEAAKRSYAGAVQVLVRGIPPRQLKEALNAKDAVRRFSAFCPA